MCVRAYVCVCKHACVCVYACVCVRVRMRMYAYVHVHKLVCTYVVYGITAYTFTCLRVREGEHASMDADINKIICKWGGKKSLQDKGLTVSSEPPCFSNERVRTLELDAKLTQRSPFGYSVFKDQGGCYSKIRLQEQTCVHMRTYHLGSLSAECTRQSDDIFSRLWICSLNTRRVVRVCWLHERKV